MTSSRDFAKALVLPAMGIILGMLAACVPAAGSPGATPIVLTGIASTAVSGTAASSPGGTPPASPAAPTPVPTLAGGLGPTQLKIRLLEQYPNFFYCDPDLYPVARQDELGLALQHFPALQSNPEEFNAILAALNLAGLSEFSDDQKLLIYREHKKLAAIPFELVNSAYRFQIKVAPGEGKGELITGLIDGQGKITVEQQESILATCPICLAAGALIDAPGGPIPVEKLSVGRLVWTLGVDGKRTAASVMRIHQTPVPQGHQVVHLALADGRQLWVSPGHPTADGRLLGDLVAGDVLDGSAILLAEQVPYRGSATYDLLPAGGTGFYWANGILIGSTLH